MPLIKEDGNNSKNLWKPFVEMDHSWENYNNNNNKKIDFHKAKHM